MSRDASSSSNRRSGAASRSSNFEHYRDLVLTLVAKDLKVRYHSTVLGYAWSLLHPLAFAGVLYIVFKIFVKLDIENYTLFLLTGLFPWHWIQNSIGASTFMFLGNSSLIKKVRFPRAVLVVSGVLNDLVHFVLTVPVILILLLWFHGTIHASLLYQVPLLVGITFLTTVGLALLVATCTVFLRDIERLVSILMMLWFYLTPVLYKPEMVPENLRWVLYANPLAPCIICWRGVFLDGALPPAYAAAAALWAVAIAMLSYHVYRRLEWRFAELV